MRHRDGRTIGRSWATLAILSLVFVTVTYQTTVLALDTTESEDLRLSRPKGETDILVVVAVDGTMAGISRSSGNILWKKKPDSSTATVWSTSSKTTFGRMQPNKRSPSTVASNDASAFVRPLLSTTTTTQSVSTSDYAAVPSIDGNVYLTTEALSLTVSTSVKELVQRAPFLDPNGKFYIGGRETTAAAIDVNTGRLLSTVSSATTDNLISQKNLVGRSVLWMGRVDYSVTVHDSRTGICNVQFGVSEIRDVEKLKTDHHEADYEHLLPDGSLPYSSPSSLLRLISTPSGNLGLLDSVSGRVMWVTREQFQTPVAFAVDADAGTSIDVEIVPDVKVPSSNDMDYLRQELERQVELMDLASYIEEGISDQTIVGRLEGSGQLYALPLRRRRLITSSLPHSLKNHAAAIASTAKHHYVPKLTGGRAHLSQPTDDAKRPCHPTSSHFPACLVDHHKSQPPRLEYFAKGHDNHFISEGPPQHMAHELAIVDTRSPTSDPLVYHPDLGYVHQNVLRPKSRSSRILKILGSWLPPTIALIFVLSFEMGRRKRLQDDKTGTSKEGSIEVKGLTDVSNEETKNAETSEVAMSSPDDNSFPKQPLHLIQVSDQVLGYGGQGTVVYKGLLDGREVAVKRMLKAYHASADREISLLIESDGHPNVVRYFLKEVRGDFVYLALELCDLSLHELIGVLRHTTETRLLPSIPIVATKAVLQQIATGVCHLHSLRIVHRDLKPANILLAVSKNKKQRQGSNTLETFLNGNYVAKISDMGLGKQMVGQSSLGASLMATPSFQGTKDGIGSVGVGPGSVGWQAPEVMALRWLASDSSARSAESNVVDNDVSPDAPSPNPPISRSVDIFSLGCIFFATLVPGHHPFGEWYEREANIMHHRVAIAALEKISQEALHLVRAMLSRDPKLRPTAKQICDHPFFWTSPKKMSFLCEFSDRLEVDSTIPTSVQPICSLTIECGAADVVGTNWGARLDEPLISNMQRFRTYDPSSVRDLLRLIRNKHHHYDELPQNFLADVGLCQDSFVEYFERKFPRLLMHCWDCCRTTLPDYDPLMRKYCIPAPVTIPQVVHRSHTIPNAPESIVVPPNSLQNRTDEVEGIVEVEINEAKESTFEGISHDMRRDVATSKEPFEAISLQLSESSKINYGIDNDSSAYLIAWAGSTTAKELNCRGWNRSDAEWSRRIDPVFRKKDPNLKRAMEDQKFRTRLCNHWDESMGTFCPMRKKSKCIFAHGPVELRVKEGKKNRWGKLVDKNGENNNPWHSGGEDTYGAARSIEATRREEGKWNTGRKGKKSNGTKKGKVLLEKEKEIPYQSKFFGHSTHS